MKTPIALSFIMTMTSFGFSALYEDSFHELANKADRGFAIRLYDQFAGKSQEELKFFLGNNDEIVDDAYIEYHDKATEEFAATLPKTFDWREKSPSCIGAVRSQLTCGSCWAFSSTGTLADRACLADSSLKGAVLSPEDMVLCDTNNSGCDGGSLYYAFNFFKTTGVVNDSCMPYPIKDGDTYDDKVYNNKCPSTCKDNTTMSNRLKVSSQQSYQGAAAIKAELYKNGPLMTGFTVYNDFFSYSSGVYKQTSSKKAGGHAVEIVGWGNDSTGDYWIIKNSWGSGWGLDGYFNIYVTECGVSSYTMGGVVDTSSYSKTAPPTPNPAPGKADGNCTYLNEFNQCLTCKTGYELNSNHECVKGNAPKFEKCYHDKGWECKDDCWTISSGGKPVSCSRAVQILNKYNINTDCVC